MGENEVAPGPFEPFVDPRPTTRTSTSDSLSSCYAARPRRPTTAARLDRADRHMWKERHTKLLAVDLESCVLRRVRSL